MYTKNKRSYWLRAFMISYALAFIVLCFFAFLAVAALMPQEKLTYEEEISVYLPESTDKRTVMLLFLNEEQQPLGCTLLSFNALRQEIPITTLPAQSILTCFSDSYTISELFLDGGISRVEDGIEQTFSITVDGYMQMDSQVLPAAMDAVGPLEFYMPFTLKHAALSPAEISEGLQLFTGQQLYSVIAFPAYTGGEEVRCKLISELSAAFIDQYLPLIGTEQVDRIFKSAINEVKTDISFKDFEDFKEALCFLHQILDGPNGRRLTYAITPDGIFSQDLQTFTLSQNSILKLGALL